MWLPLALISAFFASISSILEKKVLLKEHALEFSSTLSFYTFLLSVPLFFLLGYKPMYQLYPLLIIAMTAILGGVAFVFISRSTRHMDISEVSPFIAISPAITAFMGFVFLGESLSFLQLAGLLIIVIGIYILELKDKVHPLSPFTAIYTSRYIHLIFFALILYGFTDVFGKVLLSRYHLEPGVYLFYYQLFLALFFLLVISFRKKTNEYQAKIVAGRDAYLVIAIALLVIAYRFAHLSAMKLTDIGIALAIYRSSTLITTIVGGRLYKEEGLVRKGIAAVAVILGIVLVAL